MAQEVTTDHRLAEANHNETTHSYSFTDENGVKFTIAPEVDWINNVVNIGIKQYVTNSLRIGQFEGKGNLSTTLSWEAPKGVTIQVNEISIKTRIYSNYNAYCKIGTGNATNKDTKVSNAFAENTTVTGTGFAEGNSSTDFNYYMSGGPGIFEHAGSIYIDNITVKYTCKKAVFDENEAETVVPAAHFTGDVTVKRAMASDKYHALCLPFDYAPTGWEIYEMSSQKVDNGNVTFVFNEASSITAGRPCIVKTSADIAEIVVNNVTLVNEPSTVNPGYADFKGTFVPTTLAQGDIYLSNSNAFKELSAASANMKGFRSYITNVNAASNSSFGIQFGDTVTAIQTVNGDILANDAPIYNIKGQRVSFPTEAGVYVQNGRKFIIK